MSESSATGQQPKPVAKPRKFQAIKGVRDILPAGIRSMEPRGANRARNFRAHSDSPKFACRFLSKRNSLRDPSARKPTSFPRKCNRSRTGTTPPSRLRPEATASVGCARTLSMECRRFRATVKLYYMGPMFRREQQQKGRYRQFYQIGAEVLGPSGRRTGNRCRSHRNADGVV